MPFEAADCGSGGRWSKGDTRPLTRDTRDSRRLGCEEDLLLPMPPDIIGFIRRKHYEECQPSSLRRPQDSPQVMEAVGENPA